MSRAAAEGNGRRSARRRRPSLLSALLGAGLLIVLGFALGIVAGLMLEEPQLLLDYVTGRTHTLALVPPPTAPLGAQAPPAASGALPAPPDVAARAQPGATPAAAPQAPPGVAAQAASRPAPNAPPSRPAPSVDAAPPAAEPAPSPPGGGGFSVQVGAFADAAPAEQLARKLRAQGLPVYVAPAAGSDARKWRVRVGPLADRGDAERIAERLEKRDKLPTWVLAEGAP